MPDPSEYANVDDEAGADEDPDDYPTLSACLERAAAVVERASAEYRSPAVLWTGGKDSTLALYVCREVAAERGVDTPPAVFVDHFQHFAATHEFVDRWSDAFGVDVVRAANEDVGAYVREHDLDPGDEIPVAALNERNRRQVREVLGYDGETFPFLLDTYVGNHLLKTVPLHDAIAERGFDAVVSGVRWDEGAARADETFVSPRRGESEADGGVDTGFPPHDRVHPILPFREADVWAATWNYVVPDLVPEYPAGYVPESSTDLPAGMTAEAVPVAPGYFEGYRSLGSEPSTTATGDAPAWRQDLNATDERAGRAQDKEELMERLRDLGYM